ncbi:hypothetical protein [Halomonas piscis]|nr:hypothetical protein [Halomonas piscis]
MNNSYLMARQINALEELIADQGATDDTWLIKEKLRWIQKESTPNDAR